jgi:hypothetical protein
MANFTLTTYQTKAVDQLAANLDRLLGLPNTEDRHIVVKAPTGSGKTVILGAALHALADQSPHPFAALWLTPGKGSLHTQTATRLADLLSDSALTVGELDRPYLSTNRALPDRTVLIVNWEKITEQKKGSWSNKLTRDGEQRNLFETLTATATTGTNLLVIVDESHQHLSGTQTKAMMEAIARICPFIQVDVSATPTTRLDPEKMGEDGSHYMVNVKRSDVVAAEMIVVDCVLNPGLGAEWNEGAPTSVQERVLAAAWRRRNQMEAAYRQLGSPVVPLLLVQLPDKDEGAARKSAVEAFLDAQAVPTEQRAVWLDKEKTPNLKTISDNTSEIRVLLFKQAVATGWDCPRAAVLAQFRDVKSSTFQLQTVGRICRMPERRHYRTPDPELAEAAELLNNAYVYTVADDGQPIDVVRPDDDTPLRDTRLSFGSGTYPDTGLILTSTYQPIGKLYDYIPTCIDRIISAQLDTAFADLPPTPDGQQVQRAVVRDVRLNLDAAESGALHGETLTGTDDEAAAAAQFDQLLTADISPYTRPNSNREQIRRGIDLWFARNRAAYTPSQQRQACLRNRDKVVAAISAACQTVSGTTIVTAEQSAQDTRQITTHWEIYQDPDSNLVDKRRCTDVSRWPGYLTTPALVPGRLSKPEELFATVMSRLHAEQHITWWWKNPENTPIGLGLRRIDPDGSDHAHYPDFVVLTASRCLWVLEVKEVGDMDAANEYRAYALAQWARHEGSRERVGVFGPAPQVNAGLVVPYEVDGDVTLYLADPDNWHHPTQRNLRLGVGWAPLHLQ